MKGQTATKRIRGTTWAFAALPLITFCWLGLLAFKSGPIYHGFKAPSPITTKMLMAYGPVGLPLFGVIACCTIVLSEFFWPRRRLPYAVSSLSMLLAMCAFRGLLFSYVGPAVGP